MNSSKKNVLIVEDDNLLLMVTTTLVQKLGHQVVATARDGETALRHVENFSPDIVLMDIRIKGEWDGIETTRRIKMNHSVPIVYLSGSSYPNSRDRAQQIGYEGFLTKPIQINQLKQAFDKVFNPEASLPFQKKQKISSRTT